MCDILPALTSGGAVGYNRIMAACAAVGAACTFTCAEMSDGEHPPSYRCGPEAGGCTRQLASPISPRISLSSLAPSLSSVLPSPLLSSLLSLT